MPVSYFPPALKLHPGIFPIPRCATYGLVTGRCLYHYHLILDGGLYGYTTTRNTAIKVLLISYTFMSPQLEGSLLNSVHIGMLLLLATSMAQTACLVNKMRIQLLNCLWITEQCTWMNCNRSYTKVQVSGPASVQFFVLSVILDSLEKC